MAAMSGRDRSGSAGVNEMLTRLALVWWLAEAGGHVVVRDKFPPAWLSKQCAVLRQRWSVTCSRVWGAAAPAGRQGRQTLKETSRKTFDRLRATLWQTIARRYKVALLVLGGALVAAVLLVIIIKVPQRQAASWRGQPGVELKDLPKLENDARTTLIQGLGGLVLLVGLYLTLRNLQLTQYRQITEHYTRAVEQLGSDKLEVRLGAIYALERIARDSERDHWPIMEILTAYVRERAPIGAELPPQEDIQPNETPPTTPKPATDIQAVLTVLGRRARTYRKGEDQGLDLARTNLRYARLAGTHLEGAHLANTHLEEALLTGIHLEHAFLMYTHKYRLFCTLSAHLSRLALLHYCVLTRPPCTEGGPPMPRALLSAVLSLSTARQD
jgi:hypothetical protein